MRLVGRFFICIMYSFTAFTSCLSDGVGSDTLSPGQTLSESQTLISQDKIFELGFFKPSVTCRNMYLGIWYRDSTDIIVWVANRDKPMFFIQSPLKLQLSKVGNLILFDESQTVSLTDLVLQTPLSVEAVLLYTGNFVLRDSSRPYTIIWQSFDHPTDTWLPGAKLGIHNLDGKIQLISWKNKGDPSTGLFSFGIDPDGINRFVLEWNMSKTYWHSGDWNGQMLNHAPEFSYTYEFKRVMDENETYFTYSLFNTRIMSRLVMDLSGEIKQLASLRGNSDWSPTSSYPKQQSQVYALCGAFGIFINSSNSCECLQGFKPFSDEDTSLNDWSAGCIRKTTLNCDNRVFSNTKKDGFSQISNVRLPANPQAYRALSSTFCKLNCMKSCSCTAYAYNDGGCLIWDGDLLDLQLISYRNSSKQDLYLKLAASELQNERGKNIKPWMIITVLISLSVLVSGGLICCRMRRLIQKGEKDSSQDFLSFDFNVSSNVTEDESNTANNMRKGVKKDSELPLFSFASVSKATDSFSEGNKLGEGGFGPVYKGKSLKGLEVAVKRLSKRSGQGLEEFSNEMTLIAKLQHRNLVRLLGYCINQDESILIYEYMPNKSLDFFLFDANKKEKLDWRTRSSIIEGIAQGLLYLHQYSRLRIIHRDLKPSNILLDSEMNPKISDFGLARIFGGNEAQANTKRIVGTHGYMAPEYVMKGIFSVKSDVFSFGVLLLEIVSGKKNTGFYHRDSLSLLGWTWELWNTDRAMELMDPALDDLSTSTLLKYINIGLLCVQENRSDRPTMSTVISMITNELAPLSAPKQPAFSTNSWPSNTGNCSVNSLTVSMVEPR